MAKQMTVPILIIALGGSVLFSSPAGLVAAQEVIKVERVRNLGSGFRLENQMRPSKSSFEAVGHFVFLYYKKIELSQTDIVSVAPSGKQALFQDGPTGDIVLFVVANQNKRTLLPFSGSLVQGFRWTRDETEVNVTFQDNSVRSVKTR